MSKLVLIFFFLSTVHCFTHDALVNSLYQYVQDGSEQQKVNNQNDIQLNDSFKRAHLISYDIPQIDYDFIHNILGQAVPKSNTDFDLPLASIEPGHNTQSNSLLTESNTNTDSTLTVPKLTYDIPNVDNDFINNFVTKDFSNSNKETPILISDNVNQGTSSSSTSSSINPENKISVISTLDQIFKNLDDLLVNQEVLDTDENNKFLFLNDYFNIESVQNLNAIQNQLDQDLENIIDSVLIGKSETDPVEFELDPMPEYEIHEILLDHVSPSSVLPEPEAETLSPLQIQENHQQHLQAQIQSETEIKNNQHQTDQTILSNNNDELIEIGNDAEHSYENLFFKINEEDFKYPLPHFQPHVVEIYNPSAPEYTSHSEVEEVEGTDLNSDIDNFLQNHLNNEINNFVNNDNINLNNDVISGEDGDEIQGYFEYIRAGAVHIACDNIACDIAVIALLRYGFLGKNIAII